MFSLLVSSSISLSVCMKRRPPEAIFEPLCAFDCVPGASFFSHPKPENLKIEPPVLPKWFRVSHRFDESLEPLATTNCDDISRERSRVHRKCFDKVLDALVRYYARFVVESWSERKNERKRERGFERGKKKKKFVSVLLSLSLSLLFFFSLFLSPLSLSFFLSKKMRRRDFLVFLTPFVWKKKRAGSYRRIKENYNIFARTETSKRKRKEQKTSDVEKRRAFVRFVGSYATCATLTRRQSSFCVDKIFCIFYGREEEMGEEDPKPRKKSSLSSLFFSSLSLLTR